MPDIAGENVDPSAHFCEGSAGKFQLHLSYIVGKSLILPPRCYRLCSAVAARSCALYVNAMSEHKVTLKWARGGAIFVSEVSARSHLDI